MSKPLAPRVLKLCCSERLPYGQALALQLMLRAKLQHDATQALGYLIALEHPPVVTLGKRGTLKHLFAPNQLIAQNIEVFRVDRGGEATYHEPGQLVIYPIVHLERLGLGVVDLIRGMASCLSETAKEYGVTSSYDEDHPGLWTPSTPFPRKLASVGMRVSGGVTTHGAAINVSNAMQGFSLIIPCGMPQTPFASICGESSQNITVAHFRDRFLPRFAQFLNIAYEVDTLELPLKDTWIAPLHTHDYT